MRLRKCFIVCLAVLLMTVLITGTALAKVVEPGKEFYFLDNANVLSEATEGEIFFSNELLFESCGAQIVVVTLKTTGSMEIDDYAYELFNQWGIGDKSKKNGFLLLLAIDDEDYYAVCGDNLQSRFTSSALKTFFDDYLEEDFAAGNYDAGVKSFFEAVFKRISDTYNADVTVAQGIAAYEAWVADGKSSDLSRQGSGSTQTGRRDREEDSGMAMLGAVLFIVLILFIIVLIRRRRRFYRSGPAVPPVIINTGHTPPPPGPMHGRYRGAGMGGLRGTHGAGVRPPSRPSTGSSFGSSFFGGSSFGRSSSGSSSSGSSSSGRSSFGGFSSGRSSFGGSRSSSGGSRSFGSARGGGGGSRGGGAGRGRH